MLLTLRLQALSLCYYDGGLEESKLTERQRRFQVKELPSVLEMLSFTFYASQCSLGVFVEYRDFMAWIKEKDEYAKIPNPIIPSLRYVAHSFLLLGIYLVALHYIPINYVWSEEFAHHSLAFKLGYTFIGWIG